MSSRDKILAAVAQNQPASTPLPDLTVFEGDTTGLTEKYTTVLAGIGGASYQVSSYQDITDILNAKFTKGRIISYVGELNPDGAYVFNDNVHSLEDVELAVLKAHFAVAENGAVWITEELMGRRVMPFICQHLAVVVPADKIVPNMHEAYKIIGNGGYGYGAFIAGPSKTADIEQSLVLGAHGPRSMTVFLLSTSGA